MTVRFLQLSDIHFGQEKDGNLPEHDDVRKRLTEDAADEAKKHGNADMILVVGDTAFSGKEHEYKRAGEWLDALANAVGCKEKSVRLIPGNHDCDRSKVSEVCRIMHEQLRAGTPKSVNSTLAKIAKDDKDNSSPSPLLPKLGAYQQFAASYGSDFKQAGQPFWTHDFEFEDAGVTLRLFGMNSVQVCDDKDTVGKMILGNAQYVLDTEPHVIPIVLVHHPLKWLMDSAEAEQYLHNRAHVIMVGHEHIPRFSKVQTGTHERVDLSSGATNPPENGALYKHTYNWIEMNIESRADGGCNLSVKVISRAWSPDTTRFTADRPRMNDADSVVFDVVCPRLKPLKNEKKETALTAMTSNPTQVPAAPAEVAKGGARMKPSNDDVEQLQFLFWRYLSWQQRLKVLVTADVLPASADKPIPQTLERLAVDTAREQGKLAEVWDAMLPFLPEAKRKPNPFKTAEETK